MNRTQQLNDLIRQAGLSADDLAALVDVSPREMRRWLDGSAPIPESLFTFLHSYLELRAISAGVSCPVQR